VKIKPPTLYWAEGPAVPGGLILACTLDALVGAIIGPEYEPGLAADVALALREAWLVREGAELQERFLRAALANGSLAWAACSDEERTRLNRPKGSGQDHGEPWDGRTLLVLVNAGRGPRAGAGTR
jgi:hypothetical protein